MPKIFLTEEQIGFMLQARAILMLIAEREYFHIPSSHNAEVDRAIKNVVSGLVRLGAVVEHDGKLYAGSRIHAVIDTMSLIAHKMRA